MVHPIISIIIPAYNLEKYILQCLESLSAQSLSQDLFEIIIIDDSSTDSTMEKIQNFKGLKNLSLLSTLTNSGPGTARNIGVENAIGEYILFLDGDDLLMKHGLEIIFKNINTTKADALTYNWTYYNDISINNKVIPRQNFLDNIPIGHDNVIKSYLGLRGVDGSVIFTIVKRSIFIENNIQFPSGYHEDISVIFKIYYFASTVAGIDDVVYIKRNRKDSIVNTFESRHIRGILKAWVEMMDFVVNQLGKNNSNKYLTNYYSGINGIISGLVDKTLKIDNFKERIGFYKSIYEELKKDSFLDVGSIDNFPNLTAKDKKACRFIQTMIKSNMDMEDQIREFENLV